MQLCCPECLMPPPAAPWPPSALGQRERLAFHPPGVLAFGARAGMHMCGVDTPGGPHDAQVHTPRTCTRVEHAMSLGGPPGCARVTPLPRRPPSPAHRYPGPARPMGAGRGRQRVRLFSYCSPSPLGIAVRGLPAQTIMLFAPLTGHPIRILLFSYRVAQIP